MSRLPLSIRTLNRVGAGLRALGLDLPRMQEAQLLNAAAKETGLDDFGDPLFREGLGRLLAALEEEEARRKAKEDEERRIAAEELPWRGHLNIVMGLAQFGVLLSKIEASERLSGGSTNYMFR